MTSKKVAEQTWDWITGTGRLAYVAQQRIEREGLDAFLEAAAREWDRQGQPAFMNGMKDVMMTLAFAGMEWA